VAPGAPTDLEGRADLRERQRKRARTTIGLLSLAGLAVAALVLAGRIPPDAALSGILIGAACFAVLLLLALPPGDAKKFFSRVKSLSLGSLGIELRDYARYADELGDSEDPEDGEQPSSLLDLRLGLETKLTYLAKHVLATDPKPKNGIPTFLTVGSLRHDGYLTDDQAEMAVEILSIRDFELRQLPTAERNVFEAGAGKFVDVVRVEVFSKQVKKALADFGWFTLELFPDRPNRRDLLVQSKRSANSVQHHVIPVFATNKRSKLLASPTKRLEDAARARAGGSCFIVVPPRSPAPRQVKEGGSIRVVTLMEFLKAIGDERHDGGGRN
jgi:hypothetical protein